MRFSKNLFLKPRRSQKSLEKFTEKSTKEGLLMMDWKWSPLSLNMISMLSSENQSQVTTSVILEMISGEIPFCFKLDRVTCNYNICRKPNFATLKTNEFNMSPAWKQLVTKDRQGEWIISPSRMFKLLQTAVDRALPKMNNKVTVNGNDYRFLKINSISHLNE